MTRMTNFAAQLSKGSRRSRPKEATENKKNPRGDENWQVSYEDLVAEFCERRLDACSWRFSLASLAR